MIDTLPPIILEIETPASVEEVWAALTEPARVAEWFTDASPRQETSLSGAVEPLPNGGGRVILIHDGWSDAGADSAARDDHEAYWSGYLDDLAETPSERA